MKNHHVLRPDPEVATGAAAAATGGAASGGGERVGGRDGPVGTGVTAAIGRPSRNRRRSARMAAPSR